MTTMRTVVLSGLIVAFATQSFGQAKGKSKRQARKRTVFAAIEDVPGLPRILLIGDSISIGYTLRVRDLLSGKANVHRPPTNCGPTTKGLTSIDEWLGDGNWDIIHFNWGLHDLKYMGPNGENLADPTAGTSHRQVALKQYVKNMEKLVERMKQTGAKLIWCTTTPVAPNTKGRVNGDSAIYNKAVEDIMKEHDVAVDDLYTFALKRLDKIQLPRNVHFGPEGSKALAEHVTEVIIGELNR